MVIVPVRARLAFSIRFDGCRHMIRGWECCPPSRLVRQLYARIHRARRCDLLTQVSVQSMSERGSIEMTELTKTDF